jgi:Thioredoxin like C-terminal domain
VPGGIVNPDAKGTFAAADENDMDSPETYLGYGRGQNFASGTPTLDKPASYQTPYPLQPNQWGLAGRWIIGEQKDVLDRAGGKITFRFHARDLHLVLGPADGGKPVRFKVTLDGQPPGANHGVDIDADGNGTVTSQRLYQLVRQPNGVADHTFSIQFLDPGVEAYSFTFG